MNDDGFLLLAAENGGCYRCDGSIGCEPKIYNKLEDVVNIFHDMMEGKVDYDYPLNLYLIDRYDGEIIEDMMLGFDAGCLSGLKEISFKYNNIIYRVKRGLRKPKLETHVDGIKEIV